MRKNYRFAAILGGLGVILGAFGSHWLRSKVDMNMADAYKTGITYHLVHVLVMFITLLLGDMGKLKNAVPTARFFALGIILFSGSLYIMSFAKAFGSNFSFLGPVTPMGGMAFIIGWIYMFINLNKPTDK